MNTKKWDIFISYASEDRESVAHPLAKLLGKSGLKVWLDEAELRLGDSLRGKIDEGLAHSAYGVVILSHSFFAKKWPRAELDGLLACEDEGIKVILPVWHEVDAVDVREFSPLLAGRLAVTTASGLSVVWKAICSAINVPKIKLRETALPELDFRSAQKLVSSRGYYDRDYNPDGKGIEQNLQAVECAGDWVVEDSVTGLTWQKGGCRLTDFEGACRYIAQLCEQRFVGFADWRLPTLDEAMSLMRPPKIDLSKLDPLVYTPSARCLDPVFDAVPVSMWSSDGAPLDELWAVDFYHGFCAPMGRTFMQGGVRAVR